MVQLTANIPTATFNKRISAMNLYRKTTGTYSKIQTIGTTDKDPNLIFSDKAYCGDFFHLGGGAGLGNNNLIVNKIVNKTETKKTLGKTQLAKPKQIY